MRTKTFKVVSAIAICVSVVCGCDNSEKERQRLENQLVQQEVVARQAVIDVASQTANKVKSAYAARTVSVGEAEEVGSKSGASSIRGEMRHGAMGGYVLQLWNTTDQTLKCEAVLNNPKLKNPPRYKFVLQPNAPKPQELGAGQFGGRRILLDPPCTVTVTVLATGETHTYKP